ncbi:hypothetical protein [Enterococcus sp. LJL51]|uniref:hypothetical protein n=1 Tax=Enterococcus sp. LJL51 TaxID=3416656 RepID=UPI003CE6B7BE
MVTKLVSSAEIFAYAPHCQFCLPKDLLTEWYAYESKRHFSINSIKNDYSEMS